MQSSSANKEYRMTKLLEKRAMPM